MAVATASFTHPSRLLAIGLSEYSAELARVVNPCFYPSTPIPGRESVRACSSLRHPRVQPRAPAVEREVVPRVREPGEADSSTQELAGLIEHALLDDLVRTQ